LITGVSDAVAVGVAVVSGVPSVGTLSVGVGALGMA
jgi:hypothetical protein